MGTIGEEATQYQAPEKLNIADLDFVPVDLPIVDKERVNKEGKRFFYKAHVNGNKEYYVANSVLQQIQDILKLKPTATKFKVRKTGTGLSTKYKVEVLL